MISREQNNVIISQVREKQVEQISTWILPYNCNLADQLLSFLISNFTNQFQRLIQNHCSKKLDANVINQFLSQNIDVDVDSVFEEVYENTTDKAAFTKEILKLQQMDLGFVFFLGYIEVDNDQEEEITADYQRINMTIQPKAIQNSTKNHFSFVDNLTDPGSITISQDCFDKKSMKQLESLLNQMKKPYKIVNISEIQQKQNLEPPPLVQSNSSQLNNLVDKEVVDVEFDPLQAVNSSRDNQSKQSTVNNKLQTVELVKPPPKPVNKRNTSQIDNISSIMKPNNKSEIILEQLPSIDANPFQMIQQENKIENDQRKNVLEQPKPVQKSSEPKVVDNTTLQSENLKSVTQVTDSIVQEISEIEVDPKQKVQQKPVIQNNAKNQSRSNMNSKQEEDSDLKTNQSQQMSQKTQVRQVFEFCNECKFEVRCDFCEFCHCKTKSQQQLKKHFSIPILAKMSNFHFLGLVASSLRNISKSKIEVSVHHQSLKMEDKVVFISDAGIKVVADEEFALNLEAKIKKNIQSKKKFNLRLIQQVDVIKCWK